MNKQTEKTIKELQGMIEKYNQKPLIVRPSWLTLKNIEVTVDSTINANNEKVDEILVQAIPEWAHSIDELDSISYDDCLNLFDEYYDGDIRPADPWRTKLKLVYVEHDFENMMEQSTMTLANLR